LTPDTRQFWNAAKPTGGGTCQGIKSTLFAIDPRNTIDLFLLTKQSLPKKRVDVANYEQTLVDDPGAWLDMRARQVILQGICPANRRSFRQSAYLDMRINWILERSKRHLLTNHNSGTIEISCSGR
jgi:hypothetical protein